MVVSLLNQDPDPALAGDVFEVRLGVENRGGVGVENFMLEFVPKYPFSALAGENYITKIETLNAYQYDSEKKVVSFKVKVDKDATAGQYGLNIKQYEEGLESSAVIQLMNIVVQSQQSAEVVSIDKTVLIPGKQDSIRFRINNVGSSPLRDLTFSWENADKVILPVGSDNTKYIKYIDVGGSADLQYQVIPDTNADSGLYQLSLHLAYYDTINKSEKEINTIAGVYIGGSTDFDVAFSESSGGQVSFTVSNVGSNPALSVSVIVPRQPGWRVTSSNSMIVGNLNKGDYTVASFAVTQTTSQISQGSSTGRNRASATTPSAPQSTSQSQGVLKVQVAYTDTMGNRLVVDKQVEMNQQNSSVASTTSGASASTTGFGRVRQQQSFFSKYKWYIAVFVVLLVFVGITWKFKKEKKLNPDYRLRDMLRRGRSKRK